MAKFPFDQISIGRIKCLWFFTCYRHYDVMCYDDYSFVTGQFDMAKLPFLQKLHNMVRIKYLWFTMRLITPHITSGRVFNSRSRSRPWLESAEWEERSQILFHDQSPGKYGTVSGSNLWSLDLQMDSTVPIVNGMCYSFKCAGLSASLCLHKQN